MCVDNFWINIDVYSMVSNGVLIEEDVFGVKFIYLSIEEYINL